MQTITREDLKAKIDANEAMKLVFVLEPSYFEQMHLAGSINIPEEQIEEEAPKQLKKDETIVVYCASFECPASTRAAQKLLDMGYQNTIDYEGGLADWQEADYPMEGSAA
jgi:rhodanese-related sulfurtransferase